MQLSGRYYGGLSAVINMPYAAAAFTYLSGYLQLWQNVWLVICMVRQTFKWLSLVWQISSRWLSYTVVADVYGYAAVAQMSFYPPIWLGGYIYIYMSLWQSRKCLSAVVAHYIEWLSVVVADT